LYKSTLFDAENNLGKARFNFNSGIRYFSKQLWMLKDAAIEGHFGRIEQAIKEERGG